MHVPDKNHDNTMSTVNETMLNATETELRTTDTC